MSKEKNITQKEIIREIIVETNLSKDINQTGPFIDYEVHQISSKKTGEQTFKLIAKQNMVVMQYCIEGSCKYCDVCRDNAPCLENTECNLLYVPKGELKYSPTSQNFTLVNIYLGEDFFFSFLPNKTILKKNKSLVNITSGKLNIHPRQSAILEEILQNEFSGEIKQLYLRAKLIELVTLQLAELASTKEDNILKPTELKRMHDLRQYIEDNLTEPHTLSSLARQVGTNEQYVKSHFKSVFGTTVFGHITARKMQKAKELLLNKNYKIAEIATLVGYKQASHFTAAFKKFFGYLPQTLKINTLVSFFSTSLESAISSLIII